GPNGNTIPLTLTLRLRERESPATCSIVWELRRRDTALGFAEKRPRILPPPKGPKGEGWGEGKGDTRWASHTSPDVRSSPEGGYGFDTFIISCFPLCRRSAAENDFQQRASVAEVRDHDVSADTEEPFAFPFVHFARPIVRFV